jgi:hypothetical protein
VTYLANRNLLGTAFKKGGVIKATCCTSKFYFPLQNVERIFNVSTWQPCIPGGTILPGRRSTCGGFVIALSVEEDGGCSSFICSIDRQL